MTDQELDAVMKRILIDSIKLDCEDMEQDNTLAFQTSTRHQHQMQMMLRNPLRWLRRKSRPIWKNIAQKVAVVLLIISLGFSTIIVCSPAARATFIRWVTEWYELHIIYRYSGEVFSGRMPKYKIFSLPAGYIEYQREERSNYVCAIYQNSADGEKIYLSYIYMQQGSATDFVIQNAECSTVNVNGLEGKFYESDDLKDNTITWIDPIQNLQFTIDASLAKDEILHIAESVSLVKTTK